MKNPSKQEIHEEWVKSIRIIESKNARIVDLENALRQAQSLLRSTQANWNEQAYFDADTVITNALGK